MRVDGVEHHGEDGDTDHHADPHNEHVKLKNVGADFRHARRHIDLILCDRHRR